MSLSPKANNNASEPQQLSFVASHIRHSFRVKRDKILVLDDVSFSLLDQTFTCLVGASGSGKSTLLRILAGLMKPDEGKVFLNGQQFTKPRRQIGVVFQKPTLMPWRSVIKNLMLPLELEGVSKDDQHRRARSLLDMLGLSEFQDAYPPALSGGMAQRLAIGRALINDPEILLLDEPFGALDAITREQVSTELLRIWQETRKTVLMVTHSIQEAVFLADRILVLSPRPGKIAHDIPISLPRPRDLTLITQPEFIQIEAEVRAKLNLTGN